MKGDFSRFTFAPGRRFDRVLMQQGRLQTDADWNEQAEISADRLQIALSDLIGPAGVPHGRAGFGIRGHGGLIFDGRQTYLEIDAPNPHVLRSAFTIDGWIRIAKAGKQATLLSRLVSADNQPGGFRLGLTAGGKLQFERVEQYPVEVDVVIDAESFPDGDRLEEIAILDETRLMLRRTLSRHPLPEDRYVHIAVACDEGSVRLFLDGSLTRVERSGEGVPYDTSAFIVGCDLVEGQSRNHFAGAIDRLRLWKWSLEDEEIARLAEDRSLDGDRPLACHWQFGADGQPARDLTGHRHHSRVTADDARHLPVPAEPEIWIGAGRCYVEGVRNENDVATRFDLQGNLPGAGLPSRSARDRYPGPYLFYLDSWDRVVTASEDPSLRDPALGGLDTATRLQIVAQVRMAPGDAAKAVFEADRHAGALKVARSVNVPLSANRLIRVEIHEPGFPRGMPVPAIGHPVDGLAIETLSAGGRIKLAEGGTEIWHPGRAVELIRAGLPKPINATVKSAGIDDDDLPILHLSLDSGTPLTGDPAQWRLRPIASFKWSLDNGAWLFPVTDIDAAAVTVTIGNPGDRQGLLTPSAWAEIGDDETVLRRQPAPLSQITSVEDGDYGHLAIGLAAPSIDPFDRTVEARIAARPQLRRWEAIDLADGPAGTAPIVVGGTVPLDCGIELQFAPGHYQADDYWTVALRREAEWPSDKDGQPLFLPPHGHRRRLAPLALVWFQGGAVEVRDLRSVFRPLAEARAEPVSSTLSPASDDVAAALLAELEPDVRIEQIEDRPDDGAPTGLANDQRVLSPSPIAAPGWRREDGRIVVSLDEPEWHPTHPIPPIDGAHNAVALDGVVYCFDAEHRLHRWDLQSGGWERLGEAPEPGFRVAGLAAHDGHLHVLGSVGDRQRTDHFAYHPGQGFWFPRAPLQTARSRFGFARLKGRLFAAGGRRLGSRRALESVEAYDHDRDAWYPHSQLPHAVSDCALIGARGRLYLLGGTISSNLGVTHHVTNQIWAFSPAAGRWREGPALEFARSDALVAVTDRHLHVLTGIGTNGKPQPDEMLDLASGTWQEAPQPLHLYAGGAAVVHGGTLYRFGSSLLSGPAGEHCSFERLLYVHARES